MVKNGEKLYGEFGRAIGKFHHFHHFQYDLLPTLTRNLSQSIGFSLLSSFPLTYERRLWGLVDG